MSLNFKKKQPFFWILIFCYFPLQAQTELEDYYNTFDQVVGVQNTSLYQGEVYSQKYRTIDDKTQFYNSIKFLQGSVVYNGQPYYDLDLKYDVFEDQLLLKLNSITSIEKTIRLKRSYIDNFEILGHRFIKLLQDSIPNLNYYGFYEKSFSNSYFSMFTKLRKRRIKKQDKNAIYYNFEKARSDYVLQYNGEFHLINSKKEIVELFPQYKKEINMFYRTVKKLRVSDLDSFMVALIKRIEILIP